MLDQFSEVLYFAKGIVRNKWIVTIVAFVICVGGWIFVSRMDDVFESSARVHVDTRTMLRPLLRGIAIQTDVRGLVMIMKKLMFTQQNMLRVAEIAGMDVDLSSESKRHKLVLELKEKITISGGRDEIFTIKYNSLDAHTAKSVVQAVLSVFSKQAQESTISDVSSAKRFIDDQIKEYEQRLRVAERAKENFRRENIGLLPGQTGSGQIDVIQTIRKQIEGAKVQLSELTARKEILQLQLSEAIESGDEWGLTEIVDNESIEDLRISELQERKNDILLKYTRNHPSVIVINREIWALQKRKEKVELHTDNSYEAMANPYVQTIKMALNNLDIEVATLNSRIDSYKVKLKSEDEQFNIRLAIETELQNLNRDYQTIKKNYLALIDRREQARMSRNVDIQVSALKFKVIDPAYAPLEPSSPNRPILYTVILFIGFIAGTALALFKVFVRPTFIEAKQLREITELPVLGVVSNIVNKSQIKKNKKNLMSYVFVNILLLIGYSGVMLLKV